MSNRDKTTYKVVLVFLILFLIVGTTGLIVFFSMPEKDIKKPIEEKEVEEDIDHVFKENTEDNIEETIKVPNEQNKENEIDRIMGKEETNNDFESNVIENEISTWEEGEGIENYIFYDRRDPESNITITYDWNENEFSMTSVKKYKDRETEDRVMGSFASYGDNKKAMIKEIRKAYQTVQKLRQEEANYPDDYNKRDASVTAERGIYDDLYSYGDSGYNSDFEISRFYSACYKYDIEPFCTIYKKEYDNMKNIIKRANNNEYICYIDINYEDSKHYDNLMIDGKAKIDKNGNFKITDVTNNEHYDKVIEELESFGSLSDQIPSNIPPETNFEIRHLSGRNYSDYRHYLDYRTFTGEYTETYHNVDVTSVQGYPVEIVITLYDRMIDDNVERTIHISLIDESWAH